MCSSLMVCSFPGVLPEPRPRDFSMPTIRILSLLAVVWAAVSSAPAGAEPPAVNGPKTALDEYVAKPDASYEWKVVKTVPGDGVTTFVVDLTSQTWRKVPEVDRAAWKHWLVVVKPNE